jgi:tRNA (guanine10-N2)-dimethyltransferase
LTGSIFVLSGEELSLPQAEIRAVIETYSPMATIEPLSARVVYSTLDDLELIERVTQRAAYCRFGGKFLQTSDEPLDLPEKLQADSLPSGSTFVASSETLERDLIGEIGGAIKERTRAKVSLENPQYVFQAEKVDQGFVLAVAKGGFKEFSWRSRRPRARKFFLPSAIYPKLACALVNLSRIKENELFLDPFCGTGSLLIEASRMRARVLGSDLTRWIAKGALLNMNGLALDFEGIMRCDSTFENFPFSKVDGIATDVPYGRASSTRGKDTGTIIRQFTLAAGKILGKNGCCVIMHPSYVKLDLDGSAFELAERHLIYVHRNLTRAISILRRKD